MPRLKCASLPARGPLFSRSFREIAACPVGRTGEHLPFRVFHGWKVRCEVVRSRPSFRAPVRRTRPDVVSTRKQSAVLSQIREQRGHVARPALSFPYDAFPGCRKTPMLHAGAAAGVQSLPSAEEESPAMGGEAVSGTRRRNGSVGLPSTRNPWPHAALKRLVK